MQTRQTKLSGFAALASISLLLACPTTEDPMTDTGTETGDGDGDPSGDGDGDGDPATGDGDGDMSGDGDGDMSGDGDGDMSGDGDGDMSGDGDGDPPGDPCTSLEFDGVDDSLTVDPLTAETFTIEMWIRTHDNSQGYVLDQQGFNHGFLLGFSGIELRFNYGDGNSNTSLGRFLMPHRWYHVAIVYDGTSANMAVDGAFGMASPDLAYLAADAPLTIGDRANSNNPDDAFDGNLHSLRISEGVRYDADFEAPELFELDGDTLRLWQFDEGVGETATDDATGNEDMIAGTAKWVMACSGFDDPTVFGCADGEREGFTDLQLQSSIAGCSGGWSVPGILDTFEPQCDREAGDDGNNPDGQGCSIADLCTEGWHVCESPAEVEVSALGGCFEATAFDDPPLFFIQRQSGGGFGACGDGANDLFGCGNHGGMVTSPTCSPLNRRSMDLCGAIDAPWDCGDDGLDEANNVVKPGSEVGGVLCCRD